MIALVAATRSATSSRLQTVICELSDFCPSSLHAARKSKARWNWLVDVQPRPEKIGIAHLTLGGAWVEGWAGGSFDREWVEARDR